MKNNSRKKKISSCGPTAREQLNEKSVFFFWKKKGGEKRMLKNSPTDIHISLLLHLKAIINLRLPSTVHVLVCV